MDGNDINKKIHDSVNYSIPRLLWNAVNDSIYNSVYNSVAHPVCNSVWNPVIDLVEDLLTSEIEEYG